MGSAWISLEGGPASTVLSVQHGVTVRWPGASRGDLVLERGRELAEWLADRGVTNLREEMDESARRRSLAEASRPPLF
jgi:hypothetical protein